MNKVRLIKSIFITLVLLFTFPAFAEKYAGFGDEPTPRSFLGQKEYSPYMDIGYAQRVFWGAPAHRKFQIRQHGRQTAWT